MISKEPRVLKRIRGLMESRAVYYIIAGLLVLFVALQVVLTLFLIEFNATFLRRKFLVEGTQH